MIIQLNGIQRNVTSCHGPVHRLRSFEVHSQQAIDGLRTYAICLWTYESPASLVLSLLPIPPSVHIKGLGLLSGHPHALSLLT